MTGGAIGRPAATTGDVVGVIALRERQSSSQTST